VKIVTSFYPESRVKEQLEAYQSWVKLGVTITAVQLSKDANFTKVNFPLVKLVVDERSGKEFGLVDSIRISALLDQAAIEPILIVNSDIIINDTPTVFYKNWATPERNVFRVGIRTEIGSNHQIPSGIDVFRITPEQRLFYKDIGYSLGNDTWDYWMVWVALLNNQTIHAVETKNLLHKSHKPIRNDVMKQRAREIFRTYWNVDMRQLKYVIQGLTNRGSLIGVR